MWHGADLTDVARAQYHNFVYKLSLLSHAFFAVNADEVTASAAVPPRRTLLRPAGWGQRQ